MSVIFDGAAQGCDYTKTHVQQTSEINPFSLNMISYDTFARKDHQLIVTQGVFA